MIQETSAPGSAEPQLRNACPSFWGVKAELGLRVPGREEPVFFKIWYYTDIHSSHRRVAQRHAGIPLPSEDWVQSNMVNKPIHLPDRGENERPICQDQIDEINSLKNVNLQGDDIHSLGSEQARSLIIQVKEHQKEVSKTLLKKFYADHGHAIPDDFIDHCYDHPDQPYQAPKKWGYGTWFVIGIVLLALISLLRK